MLYEYKCECGNKFDARVPFELRATATCPKCGKVAHKIFSLFNATFTWVQDGLTHDNPRRWHDPYVE
jgi:putative FmdB family regulatory protein